MGCFLNKPLDYEELEGDPEEILKSLDGKKWIFENIVIEGGSSNGTVAIGAYKALSETGVLSGLKNFAGSSSGALMASLMAAKIPWEVIEKTFMSLDFNDFKDDSFGIIRDIKRFFTEFGYYNGDYMEKWINDFLYEQTGISCMTFADLYQYNGSLLYITVCNLDKLEVQYRCMDETPHMQISKAVRESTSIPFIFKAPENKDGEIMVDGGFGNNYPLQIFDNTHFMKNSFNIKTIGLKLMDKKQERPTSIIQNDLGFKIKNIADFAFALQTFQSLQIERSQINHGYWERTIILDSPGRNISDFDISQDEKNRDINTGRLNTLNALLKWSNVGYFN